MQKNKNADRGHGKKENSKRPIPNQTTDDVRYKSQDEFIQKKANDKEE